MSSSRVLRWAIVISVCVHLALLIAGRGYWSSWLDEEAPEELVEVRLLPPPLPKPLPRKPLPPPRPVVPQAQPAPAPAVAPAANGAPERAVETGAKPTSPSVGGAMDGAGGAATVPMRALPGSGRMQFDVTKGEGGFIVGRAVHEWIVDGERYELKSLMETAGIVALFADVKLGQTSIGRIAADGLHPDVFQDNRKGGQYRSVFDWAGGTLTLSNGSVMPLVPGAQDLLSMIYQFALYPLDAPELSLMVTTGRKFERYTFKVERDVELWLNRATDDAPIRTYHLAYRGRDAEGVDVWLARDMERLPVKIRYTDRTGGVTEMVARNVSYSGKN